MSKVEHRLGLTPVLKRLAFSYLQRGIGAHAIDHPQYDKVVVRSLYDWNTPTDDSVPSQGRGRRRVHARRQARAMDRVRLPGHRRRGANYP